jgi:hypothetical protein
MDQVVEACGLGRVPASRKIRSIFNPSEKTPSLHVYRYDWYDYSTGQGGDQIRFVQEALGLRYMQALLWLSGGLTGPPRRSRSDLVQREDPIADFTVEWEAVDDYLINGIDDWNALGDRELDLIHTLTIYTKSKWGLEPLDLRDMGNKFTRQGEILTAHWNRDWTVVRGVKTRNIVTGQKGSWAGSKFMTSLYRPVKSLPCSACYLVEGESDAWVLQKALDLGARDTVYQVFALPAGAGGWRDHWISQLPQSTRIIFDTDDAGQNAVLTAYGAIWAAGKQAVNLTPPGGRLAEAIMGGWKPW